MLVALIVSGMVLIPRNKNGNLRNISFKFDKETRAKEYASDFHAKINLSPFVDLKTGEFLQQN